MPEHPARDLTARIRQYVASQSAPVPSWRLAEKFLRTSVQREDLATELLRHQLEPAGLEYLPGVGWCRNENLPTVEEGELVAAVVPDRQKGTPCVFPVPGTRPCDPLLLDWRNVTAVVLERGADGTWLRDHLTRLGLPVPSAIRSFRGLLGGGRGLPRQATLDEVAAGLGVSWVDTQDPAGTAEAMAACLRAAGLTGAARARSDRPQELPDGITPEEMAALPTSPGVYRFFDAEGKLLYVGKARNLKRRVTSYFQEGRRGVRHGDRFLGRVHSLRVEPMNSELEALLAEARQIARTRPEGNVQREVHERPHDGLTYGGDRRWGLLLRGGNPDRVTVILVHAGDYSGHAVLGPKGGGLKRLERILGRRRGVSRKSPRETGILNSWLARNADSVSRVDLSDAHDTRAALEFLAAAAVELRKTPPAERVDFRWRADHD